VQKTAQREQQGDDHADRRGEFGQARCHGTEQIGREQRDFAGEPRVGAATAPVGDNHQCPDKHGPRDEYRDSGELHRDRAGKRRDDMRAQASCTADRRVSFASLTLDADQHADSERDDESDKEIHGGRWPDSRRR